MSCAARKQKNPNTTLCFFPFSEVVIVQTTAQLNRTESQIQRNNSPRMAEESAELDLVSMLNGLVQDPTHQKAVNIADLLLQVALSAEIRDLDCPSTIYEVLWEVMHVCWKRIVMGTTPAMLESLCHVETAIWRTFKAISTFPEYNFTAATAENPRLNVDLVQTLLLRSLRVDSDHSRNTTKQCIHWLYQNRVDVRPLIRTGM